MSNIFFQPRLTGKRFEDHALPVELLSDFAALEELIVEIAKQKYLEEHTDRRRVPRGFSDGIILKLSKIEEGSVKPIFTLASVLTAGSMFTISDPTLTYFEQAKELVIQSIGHAEKNETVGLPPKFIAYFNRIGKNLLEDEAIEFNPSSLENKAILNKQSRRKILLSADQNAEYLDNMSLIVRVSELDKGKSTFTVENNMMKISGIAIQAEHRDRIYQAFNEFELGNYVKIKGVAKFNASSKISMIESIEHIDILESGDIEVRLEQIIALRSGWYYGEGDVFSKSELDNFLNLFTGHFPNDLPSPSIYPTVDGKLQLEWSNDLYDLSLTVDTTSMLADFHVLTFVNEIESNKSLDLNQEMDWNQLNIWLQQNFV